MSKEMIAGFPADFPFAAKLVEAGILDPTGAASATDEQLRTIPGIGQAAVIKIRARLAAENIVAAQSPAPAGQEIGIAPGNVVPWTVKDLNEAIASFEAERASLTDDAKTDLDARVASYKKKAAFSLPPETPLTDEQLAFYGEIVAAELPVETVRLLAPDEAAEKTAAIERLPEGEIVGNEAPPRPALLALILPLLSHSMATGKLAEELVITIRNDDQILVQTVRKDDGYREKVCEGATLEEVLAAAVPALKKLKGWA